MREAASPSRAPALVLVGGILAICSACGVASDWSGWRGPAASGVAPDSSSPPEEWGREKNIAWKTPIPGRGLSAPVISKGRVFLTTAIAGKVVEGAKAPVHLLDGEEFVHPLSEGVDREHTLEVLCLDLDSGELLWERVAHRGRVYDNRHKDSSYATPTPVCDGERVYSYFGSQGLVCHDYDGKELWRASVGKVGSLGMGVGSSPVLAGERLIVVCDRENGEQSAVVALDRRTGKPAWRTGREEPISFSTPLVLEDRGGFRIFVAGKRSSILYDAASGRKICGTRGLEHYVIHSPLTASGKLIASTGYPGKRILAVDLPSGEKPAVEELPVAWEHNKGVAYVTSPIVVRGLLYFVSDSGRLSCLDAQTGAVLYEGRRMPRRARFISSPVAFGGKLFFTSDSGDTFVIRAGVEHEIVRVNSIGEGVFASPAVGGDCLLFRGDRHVFCVRRPVD